MIIDQIIEYESGKLEGKEILDLFQQLIDSGEVWKLQGSYGRIATLLIDAGLCKKK